jgi:hypothetical protein
MSLKSDLSIDAAKFDRGNIDQETREFNEKLIKIWADGPRWYEVSTSPIFFFWFCFLEIISSM